MPTHKDRFDALLSKAVKPKASVVRSFQIKNDTPTIAPDVPSSTDTISGAPEDLARKALGPFSGI